MRLLITGGTGFIGSQVAREARGQGHEVVVTGLLNNAAEQQRADRLEAAGIRLVDGSLRVPSFARQLVQGCEAVIHLAATRHATGVPDQYFSEVNVEATRILLEACVRARVRRFVYGSTTEVHGSGEGAPLTESAAIAPDNVYAASKAAAERVVRSCNDRLETTIARIGETYGPEDLQLLKLFKAAHHRIALLVGDGGNLHQPIHVQDVTRALLVAVAHPAARDETFLFAGPSPITSREMLRTISDAMATPVRHVRLPLAPTLGAVRVTELVCKRISITPPIHVRHLDFFRKSFCFQTGKARSVLGFEPAISFRAGITDTFRWYCNAGYLNKPPAHDILEYESSAS